MLLGLLSDTHDKIPAMAAGVRTLTANGAEFLVHCGDIGGERAIDCLAGYKAAFVWGNTDWDRRGLGEYATGLGITCLGTGGLLELAGRRIFVTHGDEPAIVRLAMADSTIDYLLMGHTHLPLDDDSGPVRIINPGALHRAARKTVALLDLANGKLQFLEVTGLSHNS